MYIIQGDHGIPIPFTVQKLSSSENIEGATVEVAIHRGEETFTKVATIINAEKGECSFTLTAADLTIYANYEWQWTAYFPDGRIYSGKTRKFNVSERLIAGSSGGETVPVIVPFARVEELEALDERVSTIETEGTGGGSVLVFQTLADLQSAYPNGNTQPAWVVAENEWYYWSGEIISDTTAPVLTITAGGTFTGTKSVTMSANETADIYYTLDGSAPTTSSAKYNTPLSISATTTLKAFAKDTAGNSSAVQTVTYTLDASPPADTTAPDNVTNLAYSSLAQTSLTLTWTASANSDVASYDVYNGATLLANVTGNTYNVSGLIAATQYTFSVKAKDAANNVASGTSVTVTTSAPADTTAPVLTITPAATFTDTQTVTMSTNETSTIYYTLDDSDPVTSGTRVQYTSPLTLTATDTVKAYAVDTANNASAVQTATYTKQQSSSFATILDSFNRADNLALGTTDTGETWAQHTDVKYGVRGNKAYQSQQVSGGVPRYRKIPTVTVPSAAFAVEVTFATVDTVANASESIHVRYVNPTSTVMVYKSAGKYNIAKFGAGGFLNLKTGTKAVVSGDRLRIEHRADGTIDLYVNSVLDATAIDTEFLSTSHKVGFGTENNVSEFEDFKVEPLA